MSDLLGLHEEKPETGDYSNIDYGPDPLWAAQAKSGANWFYWIAALSLINSVAFVAGANFHFLAGLGVTEIADAVIEAAIQQGSPPAIKAVSIIFDLIVLIIFALIGYFSNKLFTPVFVFGVVIYVFDALLVLVLGDFFMAGFHAFALFFIVRGFLAARKLKAYNASKVFTPQPFQTPPPPPSAMG
ncbi:MAG: hypothetical protein ABL999_16555 [Pyrinomonadaceae bacterium]